MGKELNQKLKVQLFGKFKIFCGEQEISLGKTTVSKTTELFQLLMLYIRNGIPKNKVMQSLYAWEETNIRNHSLNNLIYRLKQQLKEAGIIQDEYILINNGICKWCEEIPIEVDVNQFEEFLLKAEEAEEHEKSELLLSAFSLFKWEFLTDYHGKAWVMEERMRLKYLYESCVNQLREILEKQGKYEELLGIYNKAATIYPFDEWQVGQIEYLQKLERFEEAYALYESTIHNYFDELGLPLSDKMLDKIHSMGEKLRSREGNLAEIKDILVEGRDGNGAYYCTYPSFVDIYRYTTRIVERNGQSVFFMMCSVTYLNSAGRKSPNASEMLFEAIGSALRKGDVYSQYSKHQFLILLTGTQNENCEMIFERIRKNFKKKNRNSNCDLEYNATELLEFPDDEKPMKFKSKKSLWS